MAIKIFCGIMIGIFYYALNNLFAFMSALDSVPSIISAVRPRHDDARCHYCPCGTWSEGPSNRYSKSADSALLLLQETEKISLFLPFLPLLFVL